MYLTSCLHLVVFGAGLDLTYLLLYPLCVVLCCSVLSCRYLCLPCILFVLFNFFVCLSDRLHITCTPFVLSVCLSVSSSIVHAPPPLAFSQADVNRSKISIVVNSAFMEHSSPFTQDNTSHRTPVLLITDLGRDIDDTCALLALCASPELELVGVVTCGGNSEARAKVLPSFIYHLLLSVFLSVNFYFFFRHVSSCLCFVLSCPRVGLARLFVR
jgi:hypothetical protein